MATIADSSDISGLRLPVAKIVRFLQPDQRKFRVCIQPDPEAKRATVFYHRASVASLSGTQQPRGRSRQIRMGLSATA